MSHDHHSNDCDKQLCSASGAPKSVWEDRAADVAREDDLTDVAMFMLWPYLLVSFLLIAFFSPGIGLAVMIGLFTLHAIYFAVVTPANKDQVWF
jgi:hypothetical protein